MSMTSLKHVLIGCALAIVSTTTVQAQATLECSDDAQVRSFHISANPNVPDLVTIPGLAVGGAGHLSLLVAQQASAEGYRDIAIDESGLVANGLEAELIDADFTRGTASFRACTDEGFLVLAIYRSKTGDIAGVPADVLGIAHEFNYANVTEQSNVRIGLEFNRGGAGRALSIIQKQLPEVPGVANPTIARRVAELVLTENVANVFDFSESQAPVFGFDRTECIVRDHVVLHYQDGECIGQLNPAVISVAAISDSGLLEVVSEDGQFTSHPNRLYQATIVQSNTTRTVIFASMMAEDEGPSAPAESDFRHAHVVAANSGPGQSRQSVTGQSVSRGWTPQQFQQAYNIPTTRSDGKPTGYGAKIAIIGVYSYSNLQYDLNQWTKKFGLNAVRLNIINQAGTVTNNRWSLASSLATQMVVTASPGAVIYVILAKSESQADIRNAMQTAVNVGVNVIVVPFGADEDLSQDFGPPSFFYRPDSTIRDPLASNAVWIAASGSSSQPSFPATHSGVIAVGGTTLSSINPFVETAWADSGAGLSLVAEMPSYQMIPSVQALNTSAYRSVPDVAFSADPEYGAQIYNSVSGGMVVMGGTAVSSALFAGIVTAAVSSRKQLDKSLLTSVPGGQGVMLQNSLYQLLSSHGGPTHSTILNDVVDGVAGEGAYPAGLGYDIATGLGSLDVQAFIDYLNAQP